ncbi:M24 family metallopeptidase [Meiothermus granaticius]|uniref:Putative peptidase n=1 Tax=Meiothermus granaticius NBRC 107808 TaxID=1227551 RepID=A0A399F8Y9_9DEIN|nr:Xaa-Pro peptidase family protein [Meiothermus granaticius]RIH93114.1 putative peptidase [Meiothermus granaticius NBRC 107808]GEM88005.1 Xaa-Pro aminopeptidase [Meiothermus granaticius NBRC 107808]
MIGPIPPSERAQRARQAFEFAGPDLRGLVLFDDQFIQYYSGFVFIPTERPVALIITREGQRVLFVPRLEHEHARETGQAEEVCSYPEFPGERHPLQLLHEHLQRLGLAPGPVGVDHDGYPPVMGYSGPALSEGVSVRRVSTALDHQMALKSPHELSLIRESARWAAHAHRLLQRYTRPGLTEGEVEARATREATQAMQAALGPGFRSHNRWINGAVALYRGQIGPNSALPHAININAAFQPGDNLVTGASAGVWGYLSELERTMFLGEPTPEQRRYFQHMLALQDLALEHLGPGRTCAGVDRAVRAYCEREDLTEHWRHHVGHSLGQRIHESPFLDIGETAVLEPGMVLSVEPGLYVPGLGGFRHSDTVLITAQGVEWLTNYPRALDALVIPIEEA